MRASTHVGGIMVGTGMHTSRLNEMAARNLQQLRYLASRTATCAVSISSMLEIHSIPMLGMSYPC